jgi:nicotinamidase/pyrazinamidase
VSEGLLFWDVDTQHDFMDPEGALYVPGAERIGENLERLTGFAERHAIPVIADADDHQLTDAEISTDPDWVRTFPPHCMRGTPGSERIEATRLDWTLTAADERLGSAAIEAALGVEWPRILILKNQLDVFGNPNTRPIVEAFSPRRIVVYGVALDFCVRCVIDGLLACRVPRITLVTDATRAIRPQEAEGLLDRWARAGVELSTTDSLLREVGRTERTAAG